MTQSIIGNRTLPAPSGQFDHYQATPLRLTVTLDAGVDLDDALSLIAELHPLHETPGVPLAAVEIANAEPFDFDFTGAQLNHSPTFPEVYRFLWLTVAATFAGDRAEILATRIVVLYASRLSLVTPDPPEPSLFLTQVQADALYDPIGGGGGGGSVAMIAPPIVTLADPRGLIGDMLYDPATPQYLYKKIGIAPHKWLIENVSDELP